MLQYLNKTCACCGEKFTENDDIVVCPDCGTPIHRKCWNGHCPNEEKHAEGFDWDKQQLEIADEAPAGERKKSRDAVYCSICGQPFDENSDIVYCADCGTPMHRGCRESLGHCPNEHRHIDGYSWNDEHFARSDRQDESPQFAFETFEDFIKKINEIELENGEERTCFGVKHIELLHFLGTRSLSTPRFFSLFFNMAETGRKVSFNFFAGLLMPFYQFYRKMIGPSVVLALAYMILSIPQMVVTLIIALRGNEAMISAELYGVLDAFFYVLLVLRIIMILFNDYIYMRWSVGKILSLREQYRGRPEDEYMEALERAGRPKFAFVLIGVTTVYVLSYILLGVLSSMGYFA